MSFDPLTHRQRLENRNLKATVSAVDLFCGAGGLTAGLRNAGINVVAGVDIEKSCKYPYSKNNGGIQFINQDVAEIKARSISELFPANHIKLLAGCAPCQPFSTYSNGRDTTQDKRWPLLYSFVRLIKEVNPELVTMENVPDVTKHKVYGDFIDELKRCGYQVWGDKVYCPDYGLPQRRRRHVLIASRLGKIGFLNPTHTECQYKSVEQAIGHLPPITAGEIDSKDPLHRAAGLSKLNLQRISYSRPGGTWRDWPQSLVAKCHTKKSGKTYSGVYGRMLPCTPSPTVTTQFYGFGNGRFGHYDTNQNRAISIREAAILQGFPDDYEFTEDPEKVHFTQLGKLIGNAVPVRLGEVIGESLMLNVHEYFSNLHSITGDPVSSS